MNTNWSSSDCKKIDARYSIFFVYGKFFKSFFSSFLKKTGTVNPLTVIQVELRNPFKTTKKHSQTYL